MALHSDYILFRTYIKAYSDEFLVLGILAVASENAEKSLLAVECLANFVQSFHKT